MVSYIKRLSTTNMYDGYLNDRTRGLANRTAPLTREHGSLRLHIQQNPLSLSRFIIVRLVLSLR
jgi:hypothetical protein